MADPGGTPPTSGVVEVEGPTSTQASVVEITEAQRAALEASGAATGQTITQSIIEGASSRIGLYEIALQKGLEVAPELLTLEIENMMGRMALEVEKFTLGPLQMITDFEDSAVQGALAVRDMVQRATGLNMTALKSGIYGIETQGEKLAEATAKAIRDIGEKKIRLTDGLEIDAVQLGRVEDFLEAYRSVVLDNQRLFRAGVEAQSEDMLLNVRLAQRNMGLSAAATSEIFEREFSETGKITGDALKNYQANIIATARATGIPIESIRKSFETMTLDFSRFGMIADDQMGNVVAKVEKLGLTINDVSSVATKFSTFEGAVSAMSNLAASTGVAIDALEMFELANTDLGAFIDRFRESLDMQGLEFEDLNFIQQKQIAASFGIDPIILKRILSDNFESAEDITAELAKEREQLQGDSLTAALAQMTDLMKQTPDQAARARAEFAAATTEIVEDFEKAQLALSLLVTDTGERYVEQFVAAAEKRRDAVAGLATALIDARRAQTALNEEGLSPGTPSTTPPTEVAGTTTTPAATTAGTEPEAVGAAPVASPAAPAPTAVSPAPPVSPPPAPAEAPAPGAAPAGGTTPSPQPAGAAPATSASPGAVEVVVKLVIDAGSDDLSRALASSITTQQMTGVNIDDGRRVIVSTSNSSTG